MDAEIPPSDPEATEPSGGRRPGADAPRLGGESTVNPSARTGIPPPPDLPPAWSSAGRVGGPGPEEEAVPAPLAAHPRYEIRKWLGSGGMGTVYLAVHRVMNRPVALKVIRRHLDDHDGLVDRFRREARAVARLTHPNIVHAYDAENAGPIHFLVTEFVEGCDLATLVERRGPLPVGLACDYVRQAALGLQHAHESGVIHRDVKPSNLMTTPNGRVKVLDFGLALFAADAVAVENATAHGLRVGTAGFIAPEQAVDPHAADARSDVFSLGRTLYYLLAGRLPSPAGGDEPELPAIRPDLPQGLGAVIGKMMAHHPASRQETAGEVADVLAPFATTAVTPHAEVPVDSRIDREVITGRKSRALRHGRTAGVLALSLLVGAGLLAYALRSPRAGWAELVIETEAPGVEVSVTQGRRLVKVLAPRTRESVRLPPGNYGIALVGDAAGIRLSEGAVTLGREGRKVVRILRGTAGPPWGEVARLAGHKGPVRSVAVSPDGRTIVSGSGFPHGDRTIRLWDAETGRELRRWSDEHEVLGVAFHPDGRRVLAGNIGKTLGLWDSARGRLLRRFEGHQAAVVGLAISLDGRRALSGSFDGTMRLWDLEEGRELRRFEGHVGAVISVAFHPDGLRAVSAGDDGTLRLWDVESGRELRRLTGHTALIECVAILPDGRRALTVGQDNTLRLWDLEGGRELDRAEFDHALVGVALTPNGRRAVIGGRAGVLLLWDVEEWREVYRVPDLEEAIWSVAVLPDGRRAVSGGGGVWDKARPPEDQWQVGKDFDLRLWTWPPTDTP